MLDRTPQPLAIGDQVRLLPYGRAVWRVTSADKYLFHLTNPKSGRVRHILREDVYFKLVRVTLVPFPRPIRATRPEPVSRPLAIGDRCRFATGAMVWRVSAIDDLEVTFTNHKNGRRFLPWSDIRRSRITRVDGSAISENAHV